MPRAAEPPGPRAGARRRGEPGARGAPGGAPRHPPPPSTPHPRPRLPSPAPRAPARNRRRRTRTRRGPSPGAAPRPLPGPPPAPSGRGATCARRAGEAGRGCAWAPLGDHAGGTPGGWPDPREHRRTCPRSGRAERGWRGGGRGRGLLRRRDQSGAGGVRTGPMAAREWALLGDRVMGRAARRSLTPAEGAPGGVTAGHRSAARRASPVPRAGARAPRLPEPAGGAWRGHRLAWLEQRRPPGQRRSRAHVAACTHGRAHPRLEAPAVRLRALPSSRACPTYRRT